MMRFALGFAAVVLAVLLPLAYSAPTVVAVWLIIIGGVLLATKVFPYDK